MSNPQRGVWSLLIASIICAATQIWLLAFSKAPLGVPGEWVWPRLSLSSVQLVDVLPAVFVGLGTVAYVVYGVRNPDVITNRVARRTDTKRGGVWLFGLVVLGLIWTPLALDASTAGLGLGRTVFVMFYPRTSGYFFQARFEAERLPQFLREYESTIQDQSNPDTYLHIGTHPPGLTAVHRVLIDMCHERPALTAFLNNSQPKSVRDAMTQVRQNQLRQGRELTDSDLAALWLAILISLAAAVMTIVPLYFLALRLGSLSAGRMAAACWLFLPAVLVFLPKSDTAFPLLALTLQWVWMKSLDHNSAMGGTLTALLFVFTASLSLAFFTIGAVLFLQLLWTLKTERRGAVAAGAGIVTGISCLGAIYFLLQINLFSIWLQNFSNHGAFYDHNVRTYIDWLMVNPVEAAMSVGIPVAMMAILGTCAIVRHQREQMWVALGLAVWVLLYLTGKNMGEAARLWIFLMPYAVLAAVPMFDHLMSSQTQRSRIVAASIFLLAQIAVAMTTSQIVDGFGMTEL